MIDLDAIEAQIEQLPDDSPFAKDIQALIAEVKRLRQSEKEWVNTTIELLGKATSEEWQV